LETLAWHKDYLARSAGALALLAEIDPGGTWANRPKNSLCEIFLLWHPQTQCDAAERQRVLEGLLRDHPKVMEPLILDLVPTGSSIASGTRRPRWRDWGSNDHPVTHSQLRSAALAIANLAITHARSHPSMWPVLLKEIPLFPVTLRQSVLGALNEMATATLGEFKDAIWEIIRELDDEHDQKKLDAATVAKLGIELDRLLPESPVVRFRHVFSWTAPRKLVRKYTNNAEAEAAALAQQDDAIRQLLQFGGTGSIRELAQICDNPFQLGKSLARAGNLDDAVSARLLGELFMAQQKGFLALAEGYIRARQSSADGPTWTLRMYELWANWSPTQRGGFLWALGLTQQAIDWAVREGGEAAAIYWAKVDPASLSDASLVPQAVELMIAAGQAPRALSVLYNSHRFLKVSPSSVLIIKTLQEFVPQLRETHRVLDIATACSELLKLLRADTTVERLTIARIEFAILPFLQHGEDQELTIFQELSRVPEIFVQVFHILHPGDGKSAAQRSEAERDRALRVYHLLENWTVVPGTLPDGTLSEATLTAWIDSVLQRCDTPERRARMERHIGHILAQCPRPKQDDATALWPPAEVAVQIELIASPALERGFLSAALNHRGAYVKELNEGGEQERALATFYRSRAALAQQNGFTRTAAMLERIAQIYDSDARNDDIDAEKDEDFFA
jgi:hypothetical protein